ncbi:MAG: hypothetical protein AAB332_06820 [Planctomycetota bacterium]
MRFIKSIFHKYWLVVPAILMLAGCLTGSRPDVTISPEFDKRLRSINSLPLAVALYIEPNLRTYVQEAPLNQSEPGTPYYVFPNFVFPIGKPLSSKIEEMSRMVFSKVVLIDSLRTPEYLAEMGLNGILAVSLKDSKIELNLDKSVWRAIGRHNLAITASFLNTKQNKIWESEIAVEGKGLDFITSRVEQEWWMTTGPKFGPAVDDAIQKLTYDLAQKLVTSEEISAYIHKASATD